MRRLVMWAATLKVQPGSAPLCCHMLQRIHLDNTIHCMKLVCCPTLLLRMFVLSQPYINHSKNWHLVAALEVVVEELVGDVIIPTIINHALANSAKGCERHTNSSSTTSLNLACDVLIP
jgi:hypothetical protein